MDSKEIAEGFKQRAAAAGITIKQAFFCAGLTPKTIYHWLRGGNAKESSVQKVGYVIQRYEELQDELLARVNQNKEAENE